MSLPSCDPCARGAPKSSENCAVPSTGKTSCFFAGGFGTGFGGRGFGSGGGVNAAAVPAAKP